MSIIVITDIPECDKAPCKNGGTCTETFGSYMCLCLPGWTGQDCGTDGSY